MNQNKYITESFEETEKKGKDFAKKIKPGDLICLYGELGSGKTTFTKGLARGLGIDARIISPTFTIIRSHKVNDLDFFHIDLYRLENTKQTKDLGLSEIFNNKNSITVVEWAEKIKDILPASRWEITFDYLAENKREIIINKYE